MKNALKSRHCYNKEDCQIAVDAIAKTCRKHGVFLLGTCTSEGIYGEITLGNSFEPSECGWKHPEKRVTNTVYEVQDQSCNPTGDFRVLGIGYIDKKKIG